LRSQIKSSQYAYFSYRLKFEMNLALEFLKDYFEKPDALNQGDFAKACGMSAANVSDLLSERISISSRNLNNLLRGFRDEGDQAAFLTAFLRDQVPVDFVDDVVIQHKKPSVLKEDSDAIVDTETEMIRAFSELPSDLFRRRVVIFLQHLRKDPDVRDLFTRTVAFLDKK
jgi:hypothetical protein